MGAASFAFEGRQVKNSSYICNSLDMRRIVLIIAAAVLAACSEGTGVEVSGLLRTVPSRSVEVMNFRHCGKALRMLLDSSDVFRQLDLGRLADEEMVLSYDFSSTMVPLLAIDAGRSAGDTSEAAKAVMEQAPSLKLFTAFTVDTVSRRAALLLSPSTAAISEALVHIGAGTSIMDAPGFAGAMELADGSEGVIMLRNSSARHWLPRTFLSGIIAWRNLVEFFSGACEWTVVNFPGARKDNLHVKTSGKDGDRYYMSVFEGLKGAPCKVGEVLPEGAGWVVDLPLADWKAFYEARCRWLDSNSILLRHRRECDALKASAGTSPEAWVSAMNPREIALVRWDGHEVLLLRTRAKISNALENNAFPSFPAAIFGNVFSLKDESSCRGMEGWLVIGSEDDVTEFTTLSDRHSPQALEGGNLAFAVLAQGKTLTGKAGDINLSIR